MTAREFASVCQVQQWLLCGHDGTALDLDERTVSLAWTLPPVEPSTGELAAPAGLTVDGAGRVLHAVPEEGRVERVTERPGKGLADDLVEPLLAAEPGRAAGDFTPCDAPGAAVRATALAVDADERLWLLDAASGDVVVHDLVDRRLLRRVTVPAAVDLAADGRGVVVACADRDVPLVRLDLRRLPEPVDAPLLADVPATALPARVASGPDGELWLLARDGDGTGWAVPVRDARARRVHGPWPLAGDLLLDGDDGLVVAGPPGADLRRVALRDGAEAVDRPLRARGYDGRGLARDRDGRVLFWTDHGPRRALRAPVRFVAAGQVDVFALDAGRYRNRWGRVFVDACVPEGTTLRLQATTSDDLPAPYGEAPPATVGGPPANVDPADLADLPVGPPLAPAVPGAAGPPLPMHRRTTGPESAWLPATDPFATYEAPVTAPPGRWLWVRLLLTGTPRVTPRVRAVRVDLRGHDWVDRLPRVYAPDAGTAFLDRYLALPEGVVGELERRSDERHLLLDPASAPEALLPWLARLVGLSLDARWPEAARRTLLQEAVPLFRRRGTVGGLARLVEIYLGRRVVVLERFRLRGLSSDAADGRGRSLVGGGFRVGAPVGSGETPPGDSAAAADAFAAEAHRFSLVVPVRLTAEQSAALADLLDEHRPAHTLVDVCSAGAGMRLGVGLHLGLSSVVGPSSGWAQAQVGGTVLGSRGAGAVLGRPGRGPDRVGP